MGRNVTSEQAEIVRFARTYRDDSIDTGTRAYSDLGRSDQRSRDHFVLAIVLRSGDDDAAIELAPYVSSGQAFRPLDRPEIDAALEAEVALLKRSIDEGFLRTQTDS